MASNIDAFLKLEDQNGVIKSEATDDAHKEQLQIQNFSFGVEMASSPAMDRHRPRRGQGGDAKTFSFDVSNSKASPIPVQILLQRHAPEDRDADLPEGRRQAAGLLHLEGIP